MDLGRIGVWTKAPLHRLDRSELRDVLAADKDARGVHRAEARDFVDLFHLRALYSREQLYALAREEDRGFDETMLGGMLRKLGHFRRSESMSMMRRSRR